MTRARRAIPAALPALAVLAVVAWVAFRPSPGTELRAAPTDTKAAPAPAKDVFAETVRPVFTQFCVGMSQRQEGVRRVSAWSRTRTRPVPARPATCGRRSRSSSPPRRCRPRTSRSRPTTSASRSSPGSTRSPRKVDCGLASDPGRAPSAGSTGAEYNNTIRDLIGVDFKPADDFPVRRRRLRVRQHRRRADACRRCCSRSTWPPPRRSLDKAIVAPKPIAVGQDTFRPQSRRTCRRRGGRRASDGRRRPARATARSGHRATTSRRRASTSSGSGRSAQQAGDRAAEDGDPASTARRSETFDVDGRRRRSRRPTRRGVKVDGRPARRRGRVPQRLLRGRRPDTRSRDRNLGRRRDRDRGAVQPGPEAACPSRTGASSSPRPTGAGDREAAAREDPRARSPRRAFRRPGRQPRRSTGWSSSFDLAEQHGEPFERGIQLAVKAVLVSPHFLFRVELDPSRTTRRRRRTRSTSTSWPPGCRTSSGAACPTTSCSSWPARASCASRACSRRRSGGCSNDPKAQRAGRELRRPVAPAAQPQDAQPRPGAVPRRSTTPLRAAMSRETELFFERRPRGPQRPRLPRRRLHLRQRAAGASTTASPASTGDEFRRVTLAGRPARRRPDAGEHPDRDLEPDADLAR